MPTPPTPDEIITSISAHLNRLADEITKGLSDLTLSVGGGLDSRGELASIKSQLNDLAGTVTANRSLIADLQARLSALEEAFQASRNLDTAPIPRPASPVILPPVTPPSTPPVTLPPVTPPTAPPAIAITAVVIPIEVRDTSGVDRANGLVSAGVPIAREVGLRNVGDLVVLNSEGWPLAGDFRATGFWEDGSIQWVQAVWIGEVKSNETKQYRLIARSGLTNPGSVPLKPKFLDAWKNTGSIVVDTGKHMFTIGANGLFSEILNTDSGSERIISKSSQTALKFDTKTEILFTPRRMDIEYIGPLVCIVQVEIAAESMAFGTQHDGAPGKIAITKRYEFRAGSGVVIIQQALKWEGSKNGTNWQMLDGKTPNAVLGEFWSDKLELVGKPSHMIASLSGVEAREFNQQELATNRFVRMFQELRPNRTAPRRHIIEHGTGSETFSRGMNRGMMLISTGSDGVIVGIKQMHVYEPCALAWNSQTVEIQHANDKFWVPYRSGAHSTCVVAVLGGASNINSNECWAELNHPLRGVLADSAGYNVSEFGPLPASRKDFIGDLTAEYATGIKRICESTIDNINHFGLYGRMIYGGIPRYWGDRDGGDEVGKSEGWDGAYHAAFTDYYSTSQTAVRYALMSGDTKWLEDLAFPCAERMLHTQIMQSSPEDRWIYGGWAPTGYAMYKSDFNSSHSYFEGVYWKYLLTGDRQIVDILTKGQLRLIDHFKNPANPIEGRGAHQHVGAMRFLSIVHYDPGMRKLFRDAFVWLMEKAIREQYVWGTYNGEEIHLWCGGAKKKPGINTTLNLYAQGIWDMESLWWYGRMIPRVGTDGTPTKGHPHTILSNLARTAMKYGAQIVGGTGKFSNAGTDKWARGFKFTWDGKDGGLITGLTVAESGGETLLYKGDEPGMCAWWVRAGKVSGDVAMKAEAEELVKYAIERIKTSKLPMGKVMGLGECRLGNAIAELEGKS